MNTNPIRKPATAGLNGTDLPNRTTPSGSIWIYFLGTIKAKRENIVGQEKYGPILKTRKVNGI
jgi:hypothetical protein